jgi:excisionase family DNA binding protein
LKDWFFSTCELSWFITVTVRYLLIDEAASIARVSVATVRYWIAKKRLRWVRPGRRRMVRENDLRSFLEASASTARPSPDVLSRSRDGKRS